MAGILLGAALNAWVRVDIVPIGVSDALVVGRVQCCCVALVIEEGAPKCVHLAGKQPTNMWCIFALSDSLMPCTVTPL